MTVPVTPLNEGGLKRKRESDPADIMRKLYSHRFHRDFFTIFGGLERFQEAFSCILDKQNLQKIDFRFF